jgi:hypothetical protein
MAHILYIGPDSPYSTSRHRADALVRTGAAIQLLDPTEAMRPHLASRFVSKFHYETGYTFFESKVCIWLESVLPKISTPDVVWVDGGEYIGTRALRRIREFGVPVVLYNLDDPTGSRDRRRFALTRRAIPHYDLCVSVRRETVSEMAALGAPHVLQVWRSYDEVEHAPFADPSQIPEQFRSEVSFIGTWISGERRDEFLAGLADRNIPIAIWGNRWEKAPLWNRLRPFWRGGGLAGRDYVAAIQGAHICLGMLSKGNRDLHTQRSAEIPFAGGLFCAERTSEHQALYVDGVEAVFWDDLEECAAICRRLLNDTEERERIRRAGMRKVRDLRIGNEDICRQILGELGRITMPHTTSPGAHTL